MKIPPSVYVVAATVVYMLTRLAANAQEPSTAKVFAKFQSDLSAFKTEAKSANADASTRRVETDFTYLLNKVSAGATVTPEYLASLEADAKLLAAAKSAPERAALLLPVVEQDLKVKVEYAHSSMGAQSGLANVKVKIVTKKAGQEINDYYIRCNPRFDGDHEPCKFPFNNPSSPTAGELPPGVFIIWAVKGTQKSQLQPAIVGERGSAETIVLEVP